MLHLPENVGFGAGHNAVLPLLESKYHAVVNPDITLDEDAVSKLCAFLDEHPDAVMATPQLLFPDGTPQYTRQSGRRVFFSPAGAAGAAGLPEKDGRSLSDAG